MSTSSHQPTSHNLTTRQRALRRGLPVAGLLFALVIVSILAWRSLSGVPLFGSSSGHAPQSPTALAQQPAPTAQPATADFADPPPSATVPLPVISTTVQPQLPLAGRRIGLDPGHGPRDDMGAVLVDRSTGKLVLSEAELVLDIALRCRDLLSARGASVMLTRETADTFTAPWPSDANGDGIVGASGDDLQERVDILNNFHAEAYLSIHANSAPGMDEPHDVQVLYCGSSDCLFPSESKRLGKLVLDNLDAQLAAVGYLAQNSQLLDDLVLDSSNPPVHFFVIGPAVPPRHPRGTQMPGVITESLYVTLQDEAALLKRSDIRQAIALAYADALQQFLTGSAK